MNRRLIALLVLSTGVGVGVYLADDNDGPGNSAATCSVRVSDECIAAYPGLGLKTYETVRFPVLREPAGDGGINFILPKALGARGQRECIEVMDWASCDIETCATRPGVCALWDAGQPLVRVRSASKWVIPDCRDGDGGWDESRVVDCMATGFKGEADGGPRWVGCNVIERSLAVGTECLGAPSGQVVFGERLESSL